jgi:hypothetical protein
MRDIHQRKAAATRRMSQAVDRFIRAKDPEEKAIATKWVKAWKAASVIRPSQQYLVEQAKIKGLAAIEKIRAIEREKARELQRDKAAQQQAKTPAQKRSHSHGMSR